MRILGFEIKFVGFNTTKTIARKHWNKTSNILETIKLIRKLEGWTIHKSYHFFKEEVRGY